ncbi:MAG: sigma-70 family RNA polymerase sigma factor [Planctomycetia bacterium]
MASVGTAGDGGEGGKEDRSGLSTIIDAARRGGEESLDRLLKVAYVYCRLFAIQQTPKRMSAKFDPSDVGMVSIVDVARDICSFQGRSREFFGWLRQIVHHNAIDLQRRHARSAEKECLDDSKLHNIPAPSAADPVLRMEEIEQVAKVMGKLSADHTAVLRLRVWEDLKWEEIGRKLNRSADASRQLFARALDAVRSDLRGDSLGAGRGV